MANEIKDGGRQITPFGLRMAEDLREQIERSARENKRSMNAEIVFRLREFFPAGSPPAPVASAGLRDWLAGQALAGICANPNWQPTDVASVAQDAYAHADAMLAAREGGDA